jgi:hypothetical protein
MLCSYFTKNNRLSLCLHKSIIEKYPHAKDYFRRLAGSVEFLSGIERYCIWLNSDNVSEAQSIPLISQKIKNCSEYRKTSKRKQTNQSAKTPYTFTENRHLEKYAIIIPIVFSEKSLYSPCGFLYQSEVILNSARAIYDPEQWMFALIGSKIHMAWIKTVAGRLKTDYRYSAELCYNTFPFPEITDAQKEAFNRHTRNVIREREQHSEKTIAELYDPDKMPEDLRRIHKDLDEEVEMCYKLYRPFHNDEERLAHLFKLYEEMIAKEQTPLFATQKKQRKGKRNA